MAHGTFDDERYSGAYPPGIERSWWHVARHRVIERTLMVHVPRAARILEVGCGTGIVVEHLRQRGWDVTGVDTGRPSHGVRCPEHLRLGTEAGRLPADERASFEVLALFDVIEHVPDAPAFLRELLAVLPGVRHVIITVPAGQALWTNFDDHVGHHRRYDRAMLRDELRRAGLHADHVAYFFHTLYPVIMLNNLVRGRTRAVRFRAPEGGLSRAVNRLIGCCFAHEARLLPNALAGTSLIAVAHRGGGVTN